jgi:transmembrane sensor
MTGVSAVEADEGLRLAGEWLVRVESGHATRAELEAWLAADPANLAAYRDVADAWGALDEMGSAPEMIALRRNALDNAAKRTRDRRRGHTRRSLPMAVAAAAAVALMIGAGTSLWLATRVEAHSFATAAGERKTVTLSDGSKVDLDQDTALEVRYSRGARDLRLLHGQAEFDVAKDASRPFSVAAGGRTVVATGTLFNVDLFEQRLAVTLLDGRVIVTPEGERDRDRRSPETVELKPAERLVVSGGVQTVLEVNISAEDAVAWKAGKLVFADAPLAEAVQRVNRYAKTRLAVDDPAAALRISGVFDVGDAAAFVSGVTAQLPVDARPGQGGEVRLHRRL